MRIYGATRGGVYGTVYGAPDAPGACNNPASRIVSVASILLHVDAATVIAAGLAAMARLPQAAAAILQHNDQADVRLPVDAATYDQRCL